MGPIVSLIRILVHTMANLPSRFNIGLSVAFHTVIFFTFILSFTALDWLGLSDTIMDRVLFCAARSPSGLGNLNVSDTTASDSKNLKVKVSELALPPMWSCFLLYSFVKKLTFFMLILYLLQYMMSENYTSSFIAVE